MSIARRIFQRIPQPRLGWLVAIALFGGVALLWLVSIMCAFAEPRSGRQFPEWAWQHGTADMQRSAAQVLITRIKPGMTFQEVLGILGPGSADWPRIKSLQLAPEQTVGFNVRANYNNGIDVGFRDGRVVSTFYYD